MTLSLSQIHEPQLIRAFILLQRQSRYLELLASPRRRRDLTREFSHFKHLDPNHAFALPPGRKWAIDIYELLKSKGAPETCYAISEEDDLDGKELALRDALDTIVGREIGTFLSCVPGKLAYFEDEDGRFILERRK
jgi:hypothetical protein